MRAPHKNWHLLVGRGGKARPTPHSLPPPSSSASTAWPPCRTPHPALPTLVQLRLPTSLIPSTAYACGPTLQSTPRSSATGSGNPSAPSQHARWAPGPCTGSPGPIHVRRRRSTPATIRQSAGNRAGGSPCAPPRFPSLLHRPPPNHSLPSSRKQAPAAHPRPCRLAAQQIRRQRSATRNTAMHRVRRQAHIVQTGVTRRRDDAGRLHQDSCRTAPMPHNLLTACPTSVPPTRLFDVNSR